MDIHQYWTDLESTVNKAIAVGHIGTPRALRITLHIVDPEFDRERLKYEVLHSAASWFSGDPKEVSGLDRDENPAALMARWVSGATALVSISSGQRGNTGGDLTLLGSKGSIFHRLPGVAR